MGATRFLVLTAMLAFHALQAQTRHVVQPEDIVDVRNVGDAQISPDGKHIAYTVTERKGDERRTSIWMVSTAGAGTDAPMVISGGNDTVPRWSPDGKTLAFLSTRRDPLPAAWPSFKFSISGVEDRPEIAGADPKPPAGSPPPAPAAQIYVLTLDGRPAHPVTDIPGGVKTFRWLPDGRGFSFIHRDTGSASEREDRSHKKDENIAFDSSKYDRLFVFDIASGKARLVTKQPLSVADALPNADATAFVARVSPTSTLNDAFYLTRAVVLDAATGQERSTLTTTGHPVGRISGGKIVVLERGKTGMLAANPFLVDVATGKRTAITSPRPESWTSFDWSADGTVLFGGADEDTHVALFEIDPKSGVASRLATVPVGGERFTVSADGKMLAFAGATPEHPAEVFTFQSGKSTVLTEHNPQVANLLLGRTEETSWKATTDGKTIHGVIVYPPDYKAGQLYPMITQIHGGPLEDWQNTWVATWYCPAQLWASHGYVVLLPDPRGSEGQGVAFAEANANDWGGGDFQDIMDGVDALVARKVADPNRLGVGGWSYGGYMTMWTVTHTGRFKAAMAGAGISDVRTMALTTDISPTYLETYFPPVLKSPEVYAAHSAMTFIDKVTTPVLIIHGAADERVPPTQSFEFFNGLRFQGKDVQLVTYPREPHIFTERPHQIDSLNRMLHFYDQHLR